MQELKYYTIKVVYSSKGPPPALDPRCGVASSSLPLTLSSSLASWSDSTEELMGQDTLPAAKILDNYLQLNSYLSSDIGLLGGVPSFLPPPPPPPFQSLVPSCSNNANMVVLVVHVLCNSHFYLLPVSLMIFTSM